LKNGPTLVVVNRKPFLFAIRSNSSLVTYASFVSSFFFLSSDDEDDEDDEDEDDAALVSPLLHLLLLSPSTPTARGGPFSPPRCIFFVVIASMPSRRHRPKFGVVFAAVGSVVVVVVVVIVDSREREKKKENERERERQPFLRRPRRSARK